MPKPLTATVALLLATPLTLAGCNRAQVAVEIPAPPAPVLPARPTPPEGAYARIDLPPQAADGSYITPNQGLGPQGAIWHVRAALNVAALRCPDDTARAIAARYNVLLKTQKATFSKAYTAVRALYQKNDPKAWQTSFDQDMTKLYNFFAQSGAKADFCSIATDVSTRAEAVDAKGFADFARAVLPEIDRPFTSFYAAYAQYEGAAAEWDKQYGATPLPATTANVPKPDVTASID